MPKGYWIAHGDVTEPAAYEEYRQANAVAFEKFGARFLVRGGAQTVVEGEQRARAVVLEFDSLETAQACYDSPEYQAALQKRLGAARSDLIIVEGYDG
ncbi:MAG: DUF1330 domain-containing protein [Pseudomonadota bacterium]